MSATKNLIAYSQAVIDLGRPFLHYWGVETTSEEFVKTWEEINAKYPTEEKPDLSQIEKDFPYPILRRTERDSIPYNYAFNAHTLILETKTNRIAYPFGTTHLSTELYQNMTSDYWDSGKKFPTAIRIVDGVWHTFKEVEGNFKWVELSKGHRSMENVHTIAEMELHDKDKHREFPPYVIDVVLENMVQGGQDQMTLAIYAKRLTDFFESKLEYEHLLKYFTYGRVFESEHINQDDCPNGEFKQTERINEYLNKIFAKIVWTYDFRQAYEKAIGVEHD